MLAFTEAGGMSSSWMGLAVLDGVDPVIAVVGTSDRAMVINGVDVSDKNVTGGSSVVVDTSDSWPVSLNTLFKIVASLIVCASSAGVRLVSLGTTADWTKVDRINNVARVIALGFAIIVQL